MTSALFALNLTPNLEKSSGSYSSLDNIGMECSAHPAWTLASNNKKTNWGVCCYAKLDEVLNKFSPHRKENRRSTYNMSPKQRLQLEIVDIDEDLERSTTVYPSAGPTIAGIRESLGRYIHVVNGVDVLEFCCNNNYSERTLDLINRNLKAGRRNNNKTSGLKTSPRKEVKHRKK
jgi:hypothetical protein